MALVVNTNLASLVAQQNTWQSRAAMETAMERLSSGQRVNGAADDAAGLAIATRMDTQIRGLAKGVQNANDAISLTQTAEGAQVEITEMLQRIRELAVQASNSTNSDSDRSAMNAEVQALIAEIDQIGEKTQFNGQAILNGGFKVNAQLGPQADYDLSFRVDSMRTNDLGLGGGGNVGAGDNTLISGRISLTNVAAILDGDIEINGQDIDLSTLASGTDDIQDVVNLINTQVEGVTVSAFNEVVMQDVGDGVVVPSSGIEVRTWLTNNAVGTTAGSVGFILDESSSMQEMVDNINRQANGVLYAKLNDEGKLVLWNNTGGKIEVTDSSNATGVGSTGTGYEGFLKFVGDDGSPVTIQKGYASTTSDDDLEVLGLRTIGKDGDGFEVNTVIGKALTAVGAGTAWGKGEIFINGVDVYDKDITTTTFGGKLEAMNAVSDQTGVTASAYFESFYDVSTGIADASYSVADITINGTTFDLAATVSTLVTNINNNADETGIRADYQGTIVRLFGNVSAMTFEYTGHNGKAGTNGHFSTAATVYAGIRLESTNDSQISIDLGENATVAEHGLLEMNVGAADFDENSPVTRSVGGGSAVSGLSVASQSAATSALSVIDAALEQVSASRANLGAVNNRISHAITSMQETIVNTSTAKSRIMDADFAVESANLAKQQVLQQASTAMLAQANAASQMVLTLLS